MLNEILEYVQQHGCVCAHEEEDFLSLPFDRKQYFRYVEAIESKLLYSNQIRALYQTTYVLPFQEETHAFVLGLSLNGQRHLYRQDIFAEKQVEEWKHWLNAVAIPYLNLNSPEPEPVPYPPAPKSKPNLGDKQIVLLRKTDGDRLKYYCQRRSNNIFRSGIITRILCQLSDAGIAQNQKLVFPDSHE